MARIDVPEGPGGDAAMVWSLRPELAGMVDRMIKGAYQRSIIPAAEREVARMRIAELNACDACAQSPLRTAKRWASPLSRLRERGGVRGNHIRWSIDLNLFKFAPQR